jgi:hypothetical protein
MVRAAPLGENKVQNNQIEEKEEKREEKPAGGYVSSGEESTCSDKENKDCENKPVSVDACILIMLYVDRDLSRPFLLPVNGTFPPV